MHSSISVALYLIERFFADNTVTRFPDVKLSNRMLTSHACFIFDLQLSYTVVADVAAVTSLFLWQQIGNAIPGCDGLIRDTIKRLRRVRS